MDQLQGHDADDDQDDPQVTAGTRGIAKEPDAHEEGAGGADPGPDRISRSQGNVFLGQPQEAAAEGQRTQSQQDAEKTLPGSLGELEADRPPDFKQTREHEIYPTQGDAPLLPTGLEKVDHQKKTL